MGYFSLGNTFYNNMEKVSYTDRLNNFVQRFSQDLIFDSRQKVELINCKKRFSHEARGSISLRFGQNQQDRLQDKIEESSSDDDNSRK